MTKYRELRKGKRERLKKKKKSARVDLDADVRQ